MPSIKPSAPSALMRERAIDLLQTGKYSDFKIHCESMTFNVHKMMISSCDFFRVAIDGGFKESSDNEITIKETTPWAVAALIRYIYTATLEIPTTLDTTWPNLPLFEDSSEMGYLKRLIDVYMLADRVMFPVFRQWAASRALFMIFPPDQGIFTMATAEPVSYLYETLPIGDTYLRPKLTTRLVMLKHMLSDGRAEVMETLNRRAIENAIDLGQLHDPAGIMVGEEMLRGRARAVIEEAIMFLDKKVRTSRA